MPSPNALRSCRTCGLIYLGDGRRKACNACGPNLTYRIPKHADLITRFEASYIPEPNSGCWLWIAHRNTRDYGTIRDGAHRLSAHRLAHELHIGPIPDGLVIDHLCRVHCCVNPDHLEAVTQHENMLRGLLWRE
jgi:hypothetical protein